MRNLSAMLPGVKILLTCLGFIGIVVMLRQSTGALEKDGYRFQIPTTTSRCPDRRPPVLWETDFDIEQLTNNEIIEYFLWPNRSSCNLTQYFGGEMLEFPTGMAGQKALCLDPGVAPNTDDCLVYSFGISDDWSFDEAMEVYGCQVFAFDPSIGLVNHDHSRHIHFYNLGISDRDELDNNTKWKLQSLSSIYDTLSEYHGRRIIDYLKIDTEGAEWKAIPQMIKSGMLSKVRQLGVEIHTSQHQSKEKFKEHIQILRLLEEAGMVRFDSQYNAWTVYNVTELDLRGSTAYEIAWYNSHLVNKYNATKRKTYKFMQRT